MMKNMILPIAFTALIASMTASNRVMSMASRCTISHRSAL